MFNPSSDKSSVIHSNIKNTLEHTYGDIMNCVDEKIFNQFHGVLIKTPVVLVREEIPSDVLEWYTKNVFSQNSVKIDEIVCEEPKKPLDSQIEGLDSEAMQELIDAVLNSIAQDNESSMELTDVLNQFDTVQSMNQANDEIKSPTPPQGDNNQSSFQSSLQLSEESSNDSMKMDDNITGDDKSKMDDEADKRDAVNDDKMQNIKFNSNVLAAIEDENNLLDFEDI